MHVDRRPFAVDHGARLHRIAEALHLAAWAGHAGLHAAAEGGGGGLHLDLLRDEGGGGRGHDQHL